MGGAGRGRVVGTTIATASAAIGMAATTTMTTLSIAIAISVAGTSLVLVLVWLDFEFRHSLAFPELILGLACGHPDGRVGVAIAKFTGVAHIHGLTDAIFEFVADGNNHLEFLVSVCGALVFLA
jgi:hypothetical protein